MRVIKLSTPLLLIYLIFCFTYLIDNEENKDFITGGDEDNDIEKIKGNTKYLEKPILKGKTNSEVNNKKPDRGFSNRMFTPINKCPY